jgi:hypothetical protein
MIRFGEPTGDLAGHGGDRPAGRGVALGFRVADRGCSPEA